MKSGNERLTLILSEGEGERIEFKEGLGQLDREIVALANAAGGSIFIGALEGLVTPVDGDEDGVGDCWDQCW